MVFFGRIGSVRRAGGISSPGRLRSWCLCAVLCGLSVRVFADTKEPENPHVPQLHSFQSCVTSGGRVERNGRVRCITPSGSVFAEPKKAERSACRDLCGDGTCQEMVCMAVGCPCAESATSCPSDCKEH